MWKSRLRARACHGKVRRGLEVGRWRCYALDRGHGADDRGARGSRWVWVASYTW